MSLRRIALGILCLLLAGGASIVAFQPEPVEAGFTSEEVEDLVEYVSDSGVALNLRLMALDALRKKTDTGVEAELEKLAKGDDFRIAVFSTTALGKKRTSAAKSSLKAVLETTTLSTDIRKCAMTAIRRLHGDLERAGDRVVLRPGAIQGTPSADNPWTLTVRAVESSPGSSP